MADHSAVLELQALLDAERRKSACLVEELHRAREQLVRNNQEAEAEEENIINRLNKKLQQLAQEKERLAIEVEREEELISNTLQKQLAQLQRDKIDLENQLEQEQECMVNKLQRRVAVLEREKDEVQRKRREERRREFDFMHECLTDDVVKSEPHDSTRSKLYHDALLGLHSKLTKRHASIVERKDSCAVMPPDAELHAL